MNDNQKIEKKLLAELDIIERETTDSKILEAVSNIRKIVNKS